MPWDSTGKMSMPGWTSFACVLLGALVAPAWAFNPGTSAVTARDCVSPVAARAGGWNRQQPLRCRQQRGMAWARPRLARLSVKDEWSTAHASNFVDGAEEEAAFDGEATAGSCLSQVRRELVGSTAMRCGTSSPRSSELLARSCTRAHTHTHFLSVFFFCCCEVRHLFLRVLFAAPEARCLTHCAGGWCFSLFCEVPPLMHELQTMRSRCSAAQ